MQGPVSDAHLIAAANRGDDAAFTALYHRYKDYVLRLARRFTGHDEDALDVLQEAFKYVFSKFPGFVLTASMTTFLYPVVKNLALQCRRKRLKTTGEEAALQDLPAPERSSQKPGAALSEVIDGLPGPMREVLLMRFVHDMSLHDIASALAIPEGTVKSRLHHALLELRQSPKVREYFEP